MVRYRYGIENGARREREWSGNGTGMEWEWNGLDGRADPNFIRADIKTEAEERGKVRDPEEKIKKNANFKEKIWRNQYFFVTLHDNKKKLTPGPSLKGKKAYPRSLPEGKNAYPRSLPEGKNAYPQPLPEGKGEKEKERKRERDWELKSEK